MLRMALVGFVTILASATCCRNSLGDWPAAAGAAQVDREKLEALKEEIRTGDERQRAAALGRVIEMLVQDPAVGGLLSKDGKFMLLLAKMAEDPIVVVDPKDYVTKGDGVVDLLAAQAVKTMQKVGPLIILGVLRTEDYDRIIRKLATDSSPKARRLAETTAQEVARYRERLARRGQAELPEDATQLSLVFRDLREEQVISTLSELLRVPDPPVQRVAINELCRVVRRFSLEGRSHAYATVARKFEGEKDEGSQLLLLQCAAELALRIEDLREFFKFAVTLPTVTEGAKRAAAEILAASENALSWEPPVVAKDTVEQNAVGTEAVLLRQFLGLNNTNDPKYEDRARIFDTLANMIERGEKVGARLPFLRVAWQTRPALQMQTIPPGDRQGAISVTVAAWRVACLLDPEKGVRWVHRGIMRDEGELRRAAEQMLREVFGADVHVTIALILPKAPAKETLKALLGASSCGVRAQAALEVARLSQQGGIPAAVVLALFKDAYLRQDVLDKDNLWACRLAMVQGATGLGIESSRLREFLNDVHRREDNDVVNGYIKTLLQRLAADSEGKSSGGREGRK